MDAPLTAITLFVDDLSAAREFYSRAFETAVDYEDGVSVVVRIGGVLINLLQESEAHGLIAPAVVAAAGSGARMQLTLQVDDVDAVATELSGRGVEFLNGPMDRPWGIRTAAFADPAGHIWELAR